MKHYITIFLFCISFGIKAQYFSGEITYEIKIVPKTDTIDIEEIINSKHGTIAKYLITAKYYKSTYFKDDKYNYSYTYHDESKRMYDDYFDKPYITFRDSGRSNYEYYGSQVFKDSTNKVLGYNCYMVATQAEYGTSKTYYSSDVSVNYSDFEGHKVGNWYNKLKEVDGAIALKMVTEHEHYIEIREAIKIDKREVKSDEFDLPDKPIAASFTALDKNVEMKQPTDGQISCYQDKIGTVSKSGEQKYTSYVSFLLQKDGSLKFIDVHEKDTHGFYKIAMDIMKNCGFQFKPGEIKGQPIDSQVYFPIEFTF